MSTSYGSPAFVFGLTPETNVPGVIQNLSATANVEEEEVIGPKGDKIAFTQYGKTYSVSGEFVYDDQDTASNPFTLAGSADATLAIDDSDISALGTLHVNSSEWSKSNTGYNTISFDGTIRPDLGTP